MLQAFQCPRCSKLLETDQELGTEIVCPHCDEEFVLRRTHRFKKNATREALFRLAIPLGYVLFVAVPLAVTVWFFMNRAERQKQEAMEAARAAEAERVAAGIVRDNAADRKPPAPVAPVVRPPRKLPKGDKPGDPAAPEPDPKEPGPEEKPKEPEPEVILPGAEVAIAPAPRAVPEVEVAPEPRPVRWKIPLLDYTSKWERVGSVEVRVSGLAVGKAQIVDLNDRVTESAAPLLAVVVEVRLADPSKKRTLTSWTHGLAHYGTIFLDGGRELPPAVLPPGGKPNVGLPLKQPLPGNGAAVRDVLLFAVPPAGVRELSLRLDGDRCGEPGDIWFKIPASALKK